MCPHCDNAETYPHASKLFYYRCKVCWRERCTSGTLSAYSGAPCWPCRLALIFAFSFLKRKGIAMLVVLISPLLAATVACVLYVAIAGHVPFASVSSPVTASGYGRRWAAWVVAVTTMTMFTPVFSALLQSQASALREQGHGPVVASPRPAAPPFEKWLPHSRELNPGRSDAYHKKAYQYYYFDAPVISSPVGQSKLIRAFNKFGSWLVGVTTVGPLVFVAGWIFGKWKLPADGKVKLP